MNDLMHNKYNKDFLA